MSKHIDRTPREVAYCKLHAHTDSTEHAEVMSREYATMSAATVHAKHLLKHRSEYYRIDVFGYKPDGTLWNHMPLAQYMKAKPGFNTAVRGGR
jgi:hypothetical protein